MIPGDCSKFQTCSAPVCPLDPLWPAAVHLTGEPVCRYLLAAGKEGAADRYAHDPTFPSCLVQLDPICQEHPHIAYEVQRAARRGFKKAPERNK